MCECHCLRARAHHFHVRTRSADSILHAMPHATPKPVEFVCAGGAGGDSAHAWTGPLDGASWAPAWTPFAGGGGAEQPLWEYWLALPPLGFVTPQSPVSEASTASMIGLFVALMFSAAWRSKRQRRAG